MKQNRRKHSPSFKARVALEAYQDGREARISLGNYFRFYNNERLHQTHGYRTPYRGVHINPCRINQ